MPLVKLLHLKSSSEIRTQTFPRLFFFVFLSYFSFSIFLFFKRRLHAVGQVMRVKFCPGHLPLVFTSLLAPSDTRLLPPTPTPLHTPAMLSPGVSQAVRTKFLQKPIDFTFAILKSPNFSRTSESLMV